jgi:hypothetical protein
VHVTIPSTDPPNVGTATSLGPFFGTVGFGAFQSGGTDVISTAQQGGTTVTLTQYTPQSGAPVATPPLLVGTNDQFTKPLAFAECLKQALVVGTNQDLSVIARPMTTSPGVTNSGQTSVQTGHSGQGVYFEPYTSTVIAPFSQGTGYEISAFSLTGTKDAPALAKRISDWAPPADLRPEIIATRTPIAFKCPP